MNVIPCKNIKLMIPWRRKVELVWSDEIIYIKASGNYSIIYFTNEMKIDCDLSLKEIESKLEKCSFLRVHKSYIINLFHTKTFIFKSQKNITKNKTEAKTKVAILENNITIPVSKMHEKKVLNLARGRLNVKI